MSLAAGAIRPFRTAEAVFRDGRHLLLLDGRPMRLPGSGDCLVLGTAPLARAIAAEWNAGSARREGRADTLPLTRYAATAQGSVAPDRAGTVEDLLRFAGAELLRHRAGGPASLVRAEAEAWQPWLDWARSRFGATLDPVTGVMPADLPAGLLDALRLALHSLEDEALAVLLGIVPLLGSLVLGLAIVDRALGPLEAARLALVDAAFEAARWGGEEAALGERERLAASLADAVRFLDLGHAS